MWKWIILSLVGAMACPSPSECAKLPREATYHIFIHGLHSGTNKITIEEKDHTLIVSSVTHMAYEGSTLDMEATTVADAQTFRTLSFKYEGSEEGKPISGFFSTSNDTAKGTFRVKGNDYPWKKAIKTAGVFAIQDFHFEHYLLLMKAYAATGEYMMTGEVLFPSSTILGDMSLFTESERELPVGDKNMVCKKIIVSMQGTPAIFSYVDPAEELPIFLAFPSTKTEALLESHYGKNPTPFYQRIEPKPQAE